MQCHRSIEERFVLRLRCADFSLRAKLFSFESCRRLRVRRNGFLMSRTGWWCSGMVISGSVALDFFDRTEYADSSLDLYVDHQFWQPIALWLQSIGYKFLPRPALGPKDLDSALKDGAYNDGVEGYPDAIMVLVFVKFKNRLPKIQLITSSASPLSLVLELHSSEAHASRNLYKKQLIGLFSLRHEPDHQRQSLFYFPSSNLRGTALVDLRQQRDRLRQSSTREVRRARVVVYRGMRCSATRSNIVLCERTPLSRGLKLLVDYITSRIRMCQRYL